MGHAPGIVLLGVTVGLQYGLLAVGLVLVYRASRFVNFAHGQMGVIASALLARLVLDGHVPYLVALLLSLVAGALTGVVIERLVVQKLFNASRLTLLIATIGVAQLLFAATSAGPLKENGPKLAAKGYPVPFHFNITLSGVVVNSSQVVTLIVAPLIAVGLYLFFARTHMGKAIRAASANPESARLAGIDVRRVSLLVWVVAGVLAGLTAILQAPSAPTIDLSRIGPSLLMRGLAAALLAGMADFRLAFGAGVLLGVVEQVALYNFHGGGVADISVAAFLLVAIALRGRALGRTARRGDDLLATERSRRALSARLAQVSVARNLGRYGWAALALIGLVAPVLPGLHTQEKAQALILIVSFAIVGLSLTLLTGWAGQASLGHFALLGVGAYTAARVDAHHWAVPALLLLAGLVTAGVAVLVGLPALRFRGLFLAATTLAFALAAQSWLFLKGWVGQAQTGNASALSARLPWVGELRTERALYYVALVVLALVVLGLRALRASAVGRALVAVRDNEPTAASHGLTPSSVKVVALALSGLLAGVAGGLWALATHNWSYQVFTPTMSLTMLALAIVGGLGTLEGPILGAVAVFFWPYLLPDQNTAVNLIIASGVGVLVILLFLPGGLASLVERGRARFLRWLEAGLPERPFGPQPDAEPLTASGVSIRFGGLQALEDVSVRVGRGEIVGLIGGNGAGKSTLMNCISGHLRASSGRIVVFGQDVTGLAAEYRPFLSLARSFQDAWLYPGLTVLETVLVAFDRTDRSGAVGALVGAPWVRVAERRKRQVAMRALERVGLADRADTLVGELSTGMRRLCDLATVIVAEPGLVLLDEPTSGIAQREVEAFAPLLRSLRDDLGCAILIVEHDVPLVMSLSDRVYCLESGRIISEGTPDEVRADPAVIASYLGTEAAAIERSGGRRRTRAGAKRGAR